MAIKSRRLSDPSIQWNGRKLKIDPNSGEMMLPTGASVTMVSAGAGAVDAVYGVDASKRKGGLKFSCPNTGENVDLLQQMLDDALNSIPCTLRVVERDVQFNFSGMVLVGDDQKVPLNADGNIEFNYEGVFNG